MDRPRLALILLACASAAACGDPVIVLGDAPGRMSIVAGVGDSIGTRVDSLARNTRLMEPAALAFDDQRGVLSVADRGATVQTAGTTRRVARIFDVSSNGRLTVRLDVDACAASVCPQSIHSMAATTDGSLIVADLVGHRLFRVPLNGPPVVLAGNGAAGDAVDGTVASQARIRGPAGVAVHPDGRIFFTEQQGHRVRVIELDGRLGTVAGTGEPGLAGDDGTAVLSRLNGPSGLALSPTGVLFVADRQNGRVRAVSLTSGTIATVAGSAPGGFAGDGGPASSARLDRPESLALSADGGSLFVADRENHRVRVLRFADGTIDTFAGTGSTSFNGPGRPAGDTSLERPSGVASSRSGLLFIADTGHSVVWRTLTGF